ncbi:helicase POLQ-like isoform X1 [Varroa jacobsoni]|uniref:helicase POLQ-like isoform X1 n=2 Tax=Varroa jacobsoni TaxID=62625 RepID=UPI000BF3C5F7|nr:helicase POLQ-like isoform X1 [Varroa jacobsoni]XP_022698060.1 helicase POLQ-like isoform X1 [Varroa jacobsoni]XP_022698061.1 helicase POLQ-like isoform X1 [Varroa jacobsoni]XP_022698062.1 helicase POLQ-like isoform X1 [Varroa jacobsoni]
MADDSMDLFDLSFLEDTDFPMKKARHASSNSSSTVSPTKRRRSVLSNLNTSNLNGAIQDAVLSMSILDQVTERLRYNQRQEEATQLGMSLLLEESQQQCQQLIDKNDPSQFNKTITIHGCADFFGLPSLVKDLLQKSRGISTLYDWQRECLALPALEARRNLIYSLPTSGGKTLVAEILAFKEMLLRRKNVLFILPFVSIVQEKVRALADFGIELGFLVEEYAGKAGKIPPIDRKKRPSIFIATIEKAHFLVNSLVESKRLDELGMVIVDELHMVGDGSTRGAGLEILLVKLKSASRAQIVGMSATIGNIEELASFLDAETYIGNFRPVDLVEFISIDHTVLEVGKQFELRFNRMLPKATTQEQEKSDPDHVTTLVSEVIPSSSVLVFCPTRKNCESVALTLARFLDPELRNHKVSNKVGLLKALKGDEKRVCPVLMKTIPYGVAYHHSGLTHDERKLIEEAYLEGTICCLCCTSTLAAGVNLPAKRVILKSPYVGVEFLSPAKYKQMIGRAGRAGLDTSGESILICKASLRTDVMKLLRSPVENCRSSLTMRGLEALAISAVGLQMVSKKELLSDFFKGTLMCQQNKDRTATELAHEVLKSLVKQKLLKCDENGHLSVSKLGSASFKGVIDPCDVATLYRDLRMALSHLSLTTHLHLLYLITPNDMIPKRLKGELYLDLYHELTQDDREVAATIGVTEELVTRLRLNKTIKGEERNLLLKFYVTLQLNDLWKTKSVWEVAERFEEHRGSVQSLLSQATSHALSISHFCEGLEEFWALRDLLPAFVERLTHCSSMELIELLELPAVKRGRARQLYNAGFKTLSAVAKADPGELVRKVDHLSRKIATQMVATAKHLLLKKAEDLQEQADMLLYSFINV